MEVEVLKNLEKTELIEIILQLLDELEKKEKRMQGLGIGVNRKKAIPLSARAVHKWVQEPDYKSKTFRTKEVCSKCKCIRYMPRSGKTKDIVFIKDNQEYNRDNVPDCTAS